MRIYLLHITNKESELKKYAMMTFSVNSLISHELQEIIEVEESDLESNEAPTVQTAVLSFVQPHENLRITVVDELLNFEIPQDTPLPVDPLASMKTPCVHLLSDTDETSVENDTYVSTNDGNIAPPVNNNLDPKPGCYWMPDSPVRIVAKTTFLITSTNSTAKGNSENEKNYEK
ncbi:hypothetical protein HHI36_013700 [Cryptolaemus montrouzieri]|uniref:Uncharacterized protein n=1 Tax=Cryptolaemus montrouzieri TaxID=559131 RepID=A0ABD2NI25_9CUCU